MERKENKKDKKSDDKQTHERECESQMVENKINSKKYFDDRTHKENEAKSLNMEIEISSITSKEDGTRIRAKVSPPERIREIEKSQIIKLRH